MALNISQDLILFGFMITVILVTALKMHYHNEYWKAIDPEWREKYPTVFHVQGLGNPRAMLLAFPYVIQESEYSGEFYVRAKVLAAVQAIFTLVFLAVVLMAIYY